MNDKLLTANNARNIRALRALPTTETDLMDVFMILEDYAIAYTMGEPIETDIAYDKLLRHAEEEAKELGMEVPNSCYFGEIIPQPKKIKHRCTIGSMKKLKSMDEVLTFVKRSWAIETHNFEIDYKLDGISCILYYDFDISRGVGYLESVSTRGDGIHGNNISSKFPLIRGSKECTRVLMSCHTQGFHQYVVGIRGELVMSFDDFEAVNKMLPTMGLSQYKTPRSMVAGLISNDALTPAQQVELYSHITFLAFDALYKNDTPDEVRYTRRGMFYGGRMFNCDGEHLAPPVKAIRNLEAFKSAILEADELRHSDRCLYPTDGLVLRVGDLPPMAIKLPHPDNMATSTILEITYSIGDTGKETPVATITPVEILGKTISKVNLHNRKYISEKGIEVGSTVEVTLAGEIIPQVVRVVK